MEHTKGKLIVSKIYDDGSVHLHGGENKDYICAIQIKQIGGGAIAAAMEGIRMANAEHIRLCWNGWDELIKQRDALLDACERAMRIKKLWCPEDMIDNVDEGIALWKMHDIFEKAIADAED